jgi:hypothetical protein
MTKIYEAILRRFGLLLNTLHLRLANLYMNCEPYFIGYHGHLPYRWVRKLFAQTYWHRCWLAGYMGSYSEGGKHMGVCDRVWYQYRCGGQYIKRLVSMKQKMKVDRNLHCPAPLSSSDEDLANSIIDQMDAAIGMAERDGSNVDIRSEVHAAIICVEMDSHVEESLKSFLEERLVRLVDWANTINHTINLASAVREAIWVFRTEQLYLSECG